VQNNIWNWQLCFTFTRLYTVISYISATRLMERLTAWVFKYQTNCLYSPSKAGNFSGLELALRWWKCQKLITLRNEHWSSILDEATEISTVQRWLQFQLHYSPGVGSASNRNEYQKSSRECKGWLANKADNLNPICVPGSYRKCGSLNISQPWGLHGLLWR
jgi:hypothetical protein